MVRAAIVVGALLLVVAGVTVLGDADRLSERLPVQVIPRRYAIYPAAAGALLVALALVALAFDL